ncbi:MAG: phosphatase PAP2 family protein, partial [Frankiaceae bacterium]|nr:phosphatase PAP2 family protein [Frankiaceae bacterium]
GLLSYDHGVLKHISDPLAALPSLHPAWATWVALVLWTSRRRWVRVLGLLHPVLTLAAVLMTGNHWYVDAAAGTALTLLVVVVVRLVWPASPPTDGEGAHRAARRTRRRASAERPAAPWR